MQCNAIRATGNLFIKLLNYTFRKLKKVESKIPKNSRGNLNTAGFPGIPVRDIPGGPGQINLVHHSNAQLLPNYSLCHIMPTPTI